MNGEPRFSGSCGRFRRRSAASSLGVYEPTDQAYGDREAGVRDVAGNRWYVATHRGPKHIPEGLRTLTPGLAPRGAAKMIEFLKQAFDAEEAACHKAPDGTILHAKLRIGDSIIEIGEAHGEIAKPMPTVFYLYVENVTIGTRAP